MSKEALKNVFSMPHYQKDNFGVMSFDELQYIVGQVKRQSNLNFVSKLTELNHRLFEVSG